MKRHYLFGLALALLGVLNSAHATVLITGFGSSTVNPLNTATDFITPWTGTQSATAVSVSAVSNQSGGIFSTLTTPENITGMTNLSLTGSLTGATPGFTQFQIALYDSNFNSVTYDYSWASFTSGPVASLGTNRLVSGAFNGIVSSYGLNLFGGPGDSVTFAFSGLTASPVPEPSTYALIGVAALALLALPRRRRA